MPLLSQLRNKSSSPNFLDKICGVTTALTVAFCVLVRTSSQVVGAFFLVTAPSGCRGCFAKRQQDRTFASRLFQWRDVMEEGEKPFWRSKVISIGGSIGGLFRRKRRQMQHDEPRGLFDNPSPKDDIGPDFCSIEDEFGSLAWEKCVESDLPDERRLVRVEQQSQGCLETQNQIRDKVRSIRRDQSRLGCAELYKREWNPTSESRTHTDFSMVQFNTLAEGLSSGSSKKPPFPAVNQKESAEYGGFSSIPRPETVLDFKQRKWRILEVLLGDKEDATPFDLIALEEVDRFHGFFAPILRAFGYKGLFVPKTNSPSARMGWYSDGCCLFWRDSDFRCISERRANFNVGTQVFLVATLQHIPTGNLLVIGVTHLKAQRSEVNEVIRCCQVSKVGFLLCQVAELLCYQVTELLDAVNEERQKVGEDASILIAGDFNADPPNRNDAPEAAISRVEKCSGLELQSAYDLDDDLFYTTNKIRGNKCTARIIDYIFFDNHLNCTATLQVPLDEELEPSKLPGLRFPSDHLHIAAKFRFSSPDPPT